MIPVTASPAAIALGRSLFGKHPGDVIETVAELGNALDELSVILRMITQADERSPLAIADMKRLASAGFRIAGDLANHADCEQEDMRQALKAYGDPQEPITA